MSTMYISEYASAGRGGLIPVADEPAIADQKITFTGTAGTSAVFANATSMIRVHVDGIASIVFGTNPTATTSGKRMAASQTEYFTVPQGFSYKISAVTNT